MPVRLPLSVLKPETKREWTNKLRERWTSIVDNSNRLYWRCVGSNLPGTVLAPPPPDLKSGFKGKPGNRGEQQRYGQIFNISVSYFVLAPQGKTGKLIKNHRYFLLNVTQMLPKIATSPHRTKCKVWRKVIHLY